MKSNQRPSGDVQLQQATGLGGVTPLAMSHTFQLLDTIRKKLASLVWKKIVNILGFGIFAFHCYNETPEAGSFYKEKRSV